MYLLKFWIGSYDCSGDVLSYGKILFIVFVVEKFVGSMILFKTLCSLVHENTYTCGKN